MLHARRSRTPFVALTLAVSVGLIGTPSPSLAARPPAPKLTGRMKMEPEPVEQPTEQQLRVGLRVDTEALGGGAGEPMRVKIVEVATDEFRDQGFAEVLDEMDPRIVIVVERTGDEENPGFVIGYSIEKDDEIVPGSARQTDCSLCSRTDVIERIEKDLDPLLELALEHQVVREVEGPSGDGDGDGDVVVEPVDERKIGPLGFAGIGVAVVGVGGVGAGVGLVVKGFEPIAPTFVERKNYRTPGTVILAIGGVALIAGVVMIAVDVSKRKKARRSAESRAALRWEGAGFAF